MQNKKIKISEKKLIQYINQKNAFNKELFLDLGVKKVRIICYSESIFYQIQKQLTYSICEQLSKYDCTIVVWQEDNVEHLHENKELFITNEENQTSIKHIIVTDNISTLMITDSNIYFYGVKKPEPEEFVKEGHIFVKIFNKILKTENTALIHGACIGLNNNGILLCARGQKGKSTLSISSILEGFEYVSDDYLTLQIENDSLYAYPIYSIITLSPKMYNKLYDKLEGTRFVSNSARNDKYVLNIANLHNHFRSKYPVKACMSLNFTEEEKPSITECTAQEKGSAIAQMIHSTVKQMQDTQDADTVKKLINMVSHFEFYKINLCNDIYKNVELLKSFLSELS